MSKNQNRTKRAPAAERKDQPPAIVPTSPPGSDPNRSRMPLVALLVLFAIWLAFLAFLAIHSARYTPAP